MKKNKKQGDLFTGYKTNQEEHPITQADVCRIFNGKVISEEEHAEEVRLLKMVIHWRSGESLVKAVRKFGVFGWIKPDKERVKWYKKVFLEDEGKRRNKGLK